MRIETKNTIKNSMEASIILFENAMKKTAEIYADKDLTDIAKIQKSQKVAQELLNGCTGWAEKLNAACETAAKELATIKSTNHAKMIHDHDYQNRLLNEAAFIRQLPETMTQEDVERRLCVFYGDEMAKAVLHGALTKQSEHRKMLGLPGFDVDRLLPDVYGYHAAMLEKIRVAVETKIMSLGNTFYSGSGFYTQEKNKQTLMFAEGTFDGVRQYVNSLPETVSHTHPDGTKKVYNIPAFAHDPADLNIIFSMYRAE